MTNGKIDVAAMVFGIESNDAVGALIFIAFAGWCGVSLPLPSGQRVDVFPSVTCHRFSRRLLSPVTLIDEITLLLAPKDDVRNQGRLFFTTIQQKQVILSLLSLHKLLLRDSRLDCQTVKIVYISPRIVNLFIIS